MIPSNSPSRLPRGQVPVVHAVTNDEILARPDFLDRAGGVMQALGARGAIHVRARAWPGRRLYDLATRLAELQRDTDAWLVINDRLDVALATGARAIQLTSRSMEVADARAIARGLGLGASVHSLDEARRAEAEGADWVVAGHVFETRSHAGAPGRGVAFVRELAEAVRVPVIAIGGIFPKHLPALLHTGAHGVAAIRGIWDAQDAERAAIDYFSSYDAYSGA